MYDETGSDFRSIATPKKKTPPPLSPEVAPQRAQRPFWVQLTTFFLAFLIATRACGIWSSNAAVIAVQLSEALLLVLIMFGLTAMRRWAAQLLIAYCAWQVVSRVVVGVARIAVIDDEVARAIDRDQLLFTQLFQMGLTFFIFGVLGLWYVFRLKIFTPAGKNRWGNVPFILAMSILLLNTSAGIAESREYIRLQEDQLDESREMMRDLFN